MALTETATINIKCSRCGALKAKEVRIAPIGNPKDSLFTEVGLKKMTIFFKATDKANADEIRRDTKHEARFIRGRSAKSVKSLLRTLFP